MNRNTILKILTLCLVIIISYFLSFRGAFISDDLDGILRNPAISQLETSIQDQGPLRGTELFLSHRVAGLHPEGYRIYNVVFHTATTLSLFGLLSVLIGGPTPFIAALLFSVHPFLSESVIWISAYSYPQYSFFLLASLWLYILYSQQRGRRFIVLSLLSFCLSLASSEKAVILPIVLILYEYCFGSLQRWKQITPYIFLSAFYMIWVVGNIPARVDEFEMINHMQSLPFLPLHRVVFAVGTYLWGLVFPLRLTFYPVPDAPITWHEFVVLIVPLSAFIILIARTMRSDRHTLFWYLFFLIALLPTLLAFGFAVTAAERYVYLAAVGIIVPVSSRIAALPRRLAVPIVIILSSLLSIRTMIRAVDWQSERKFWQATAQVSPSNAAARNNYGAVLFDIGNCASAIPEFEKVIQLRPATSEAHHNLGLCYDRIGRSDDALRSLDNAIRYKPLQWQSRLKKVEILQREGRLTEARDDILILRRMGVLSGQ